MILLRSLYSSVFLAVVTLLLSALVPLQAQEQAATSEFVSIKGEQINIRAQASTSSEAKWKLNNGYPLQVEQRQGQWLKVRDHEETLGWVFAPLTTSISYRLVIADAVNLREGPSQNNKVVGKLEREDIVRSMGEKGDWAQVQLDNGLRGWVAKKFTWGW